MISTTYAFQGLEVKGQGSILASPALYKDEQDGAVGSLEGLESRVEPEAVLVGRLSCGEFGVASRWRESRVVDRDEWRASASRWREPRSRDEGGCSVANQRVTWRPQLGKRLRGDHSQGELASAKAVRGERASTRWESINSLREHPHAERASTR